jgi:hypothetical protein
MNIDKIIAESRKNHFDPARAVCQFFEDGDWLRIESPYKETRYLRKELAQRMLAQLDLYSVPEKSDIVLKHRAIHI